ncbi:Transposon TX1 uncharacterized 149 kDa protein [Frankliniella fusca]|uniref:Transposon TX1 uncharacterized 149 kDa protein n=1 Tax=Frankliniella fusca TaxID=407009 RepID=A0AAE1HHZ1_9NEOP|nr:Transposon TX1 uncharacterized 149 kDa protein [Frankliniella fusca]
MLWREGLLPQPTNIVKLPNGRAMSGRIGDVTIANVYAPAGSRGSRERPRFFIEDLPLVLADVAEHLILAGDFNAILNKDDTTGVATPCPVLRSVVESLRLRDAWKTLRPHEQGFTYTGSSCASRLDKWNVTKDLPLLSVGIHAAPVSDHAALLLQVQIGNLIRAREVAYLPGAPDGTANRRTLWKVDPTLLSNPAFLPRFKGFWASWRRKICQFEDIVAWWEAGKTRIRSLCSALSREARKDSTSMLRFLHDVLDELVAARTADSSVEPRIDAVTKRINELLAQRLPALAARAKAQAVDGEVPGVYQVAAALRRKAATKVESLQDDAGNEVRGQHELEQHALRHFSAILGAPPFAPPAPPRLLLEVAEKVITAEDNTTLLEDITEEELLKALKLSPRGRSPGDDGLTAEFYLVV